LIKVLISFFLRFNSPKLLLCTHLSTPASRFSDTSRSPTLAHSSALCSQDRRSPNALSAFQRQAAYTAKPQTVDLNGQLFSRRRAFSSFAPTDNHSTSWVERPRKPRRESLMSQPLSTPYPSWDLRSPRCSAGDASARPLGSPKIRRTLTAPARPRAPLQ